MFRASPCSLLQFFSGPRPGLPWHRPLCHHCPAEGGSGYFKKDASPEGSDDFGEGKEGTLLGLLPPSRLTCSHRSHSDTAWLFILELTCLAVYKLPPFQSQGGSLDPPRGSHFIRAHFLTTFLETSVCGREWE